MDKKGNSRRGLRGLGVIIIVVAGIAIWWFSPGQQRKRQVDALDSAASNGDVQGVTAALANGVDVNARDTHGITALMYAARGYQPNIDNPTPTDHPEVVALLIKHGGDVNAKLQSGFVALFWAARYGHDKVAKVLIDSGANVNAKDKDGTTALKCATPNQQTKVIALLKAAGARE